MKQPSEIRERRTLHLRILTPTHIGTREGSIRAPGFIWHAQRVYLCNEDLLGRLLLEKGLFPSFLTQVEAGPLNLASFLTGAGLSLPEVLPLISRPQEVIPGGAPEMQEFRPFVRDGQGRIFLPGSAIKGVLRTAVLYRLLLDPHWRDQTRAWVEKNRPCKEGKKSKVFFSEELLQNKALRDFQFPGRKESRDPTTDLLRCLTVRDAYPLNPEEVHTHVIPVDFLCKGEKQRFYLSKKPDGKPLRVWVEALFSTTFVVDLLWDRVLFEKFRQAAGGRPLPVTSLDDLLEAVRRMNQDLIDHERNFYQAGAPLPKGSLGDVLKAAADIPASPGAQAARKLAEYYSKLTPETLRLGFGSGMLSTTMALHLPPSLRQKIRDYCGSGPRPKEVAPKSRRVWQNREGRWFPLGWAKITPPAAKGTGA